MGDHCPFAAKVTCDECPWRTDVPTGRFSRDRYITLANTSLQAMGPIFACHKTDPDSGAEHACVGWLMVDGRESYAVRMAMLQGLVDLSRLQARGPLYGSYGEMAEANGVPAKVVDALGVRSARRSRPRGPESAEELLQAIQGGLR